MARHRLSTFPHSCVCSVVYAMPMSDRIRTRGREPAAVVLAFERAHGQALFGFARRVGAADDQAADITQEALLRLFDALTSGADIADVRAWTFHVAYRLAIDTHRLASRVLRLADRLGASPAVESDSADDMARREVWLAVDRLPQRQRAVLYLRFRADLDFETIGEVLGITSSAARSHCTQALSRLRGRLAEEVPQ